MCIICTVYITTYNSIVWNIKTCQVTLCCLSITINTFITNSIPAKFFYTRGLINPQPEALAPGNHQYILESDLTY